MTAPRRRTLPALVGELVDTVKGLESTFSVLELDVMERGLQIAAAKLRGMRNSMQPIHRLPPELLSKIFSETQLRLPSFLPLPPSGIHDHLTCDWCECLFLLQVCRHWRGVIASSPVLWSAVCSFTKPLEFLRRSRDAELTVYLGVRSRSFLPSLTEALAPHTSRFKEFHMLAMGPEDILKLQQLFSSPAPRLHSLLIQVERPEDLSPALPPIFAGRMSKLRQLALGYFTSWPKGYFHNLTHLALYHQKENSWPSTSEFLDFLDHSPRIEELALIQGGPMRSLGADVAPSPGRFVSLKRLQKLDIGDWPSAVTIARLLSHLSLPRKTELYIWGTIFRDEEDVGSLLPTDTSHLRNLKGIKEWYFIRYYPTFITFKLIAVVNSTLYMTGDFHYAQIHPSALSRYPLNKVRSLKLREDPTQFRRLRVSEWKDLFRLVPALQALTLVAEGSPQCTRAVISALRPPKFPPPLLPTLDGVVCPALKTIEITEELNLPFLHISTLAAERVACGGPQIDFTFRGCSLPRRGSSPVPYDSDSDSALEYGFDSVAPGTRMEYVKFEEPVKIAPLVPAAWPTQAFNWVRLEPITLDFID
ncbi:hypothetical protein C8R44DRAFT_874185 [Mycena epipterygia]|nr:hypothetical protein C8R44DRAFT_874185 [Mycena epipterygia]